MKTREVDYKQMSSEAIEDTLTDYRNELKRLDERKEWLSGEIDELQAILDERADDEYEQADGE